MNTCANAACRDTYRNSHVSRVRSGDGHRGSANGPGAAREANPTQVNPKSQNLKDGRRGVGRGRVPVRYISQVVRIRRDKIKPRPVKRNRRGKAVR